MSCQLASPATLSSGDEPTVPNCVGGWVKYRVGLDAVDERENPALC